MVRRQASTTQYGRVFEQVWTLCIHWSPEKIQIMSRRIEADAIQRIHCETLTSWMCWSEWEDGWIMKIKKPGHMLSRNVSIRWYEKYVWKLAYFIHLDSFPDFFQQRLKEMLSERRAEELWDMLTRISQLSITKKLLESILLLRVISDRRMTS